MKVFFAILAFLILTTLTYIGFYNGFYAPKIDINSEGNEIIVYAEQHGHYHLADSVMKLVFNELYEINGIVITKGFGMYFNNPEIAGETDINFIAGCIVEPKDSTKLNSITTKFIQRKTEVTSYIVSDFPLKGRMSIMIGMKKVYPKLDDYCIENGYDKNQPVFEIYDRKEKKIHYRRKLVKI